MLLQFVRFTSKMLVSIKKKFALSLSKIFGYDVVSFKNVLLNFI